MKLSTGVFGQAGLCTYGTCGTRTGCQAQCGLAFGRAATLIGPRSSATAATTFAGTNAPVRTHCVRSAICAGGERGVLRRHLLIGIVRSDALHEHALRRIARDEDLAVIAALEQRGAAVQREAALRLLRGAVALVAVLREDRRDLLLEKLLLVLGRRRAAPPEPRGETGAAESGAASASSAANRRGAGREERKRAYADQAMTSRTTWPETSVRRKSRPFMR